MKKLTEIIITSFDYYENGILETLDVQVSKSKHKYNPELKNFFSSDEEWKRSQHFTKIIQIMEKRNWVINDYFLKHNLKDFFIKKYREIYNKKPFIITFQSIERPKITDEEIFNKLFSIKEIHKIF